LTRLVTARADGSDITVLLPMLPDNDRVLLMDLAEQPADVWTLTEREHRDRSLLCDGYRQIAGSWPAAIELVLERRTFDWAAGRFTDYRRVDTRPVALAALCETLGVAEGDR